MSDLPACRCGSLDVHLFRIGSRREWLCLRCLDAMRFLAPVREPAVLERVARHGIPARTEPR